jgi:hypothetical protein
VAKSPINPAGSRAGRGFRYQDAVGALLAVQGWTGASPFGAVTPEAHDDFDLIGAQDRAFVQAKSRRSEAGEFSVSDAAAYIAELWDRHEAAGAPPDSLVLVLERGVRGLALAPWQDHPLPNEFLGATRLSGDRRADRLAAKTSVRIVPSPMDEAIRLISAELTCTPAEASIHYGEIVRRIGALSNENGPLGPIKALPLTRTDVGTLVDQMRSLVALDDMDEAVKAGLCEAIDFITPLADETFYLGVDVEPGHLAAGLVAERPETRDEVLSALETRGVVLVTGPSGAGKSALMWDAASVHRHVVRWYRVRTLGEGHAPALQRLARALRASPRTPVGFVFDDVGGDLHEAWDALVRLTPAGSGVLILGSIREEDLFLLQTRSRTTEIAAEADDGLAERLWSELRDRGQTSWAGWVEPWRMANGLMLEYAHILTRGERMSAVLTEQVDRREREGRALELSVLRLTSFAGAASAHIDAERLPAVLGVSDAEVSAALRRLVAEHLLRIGPDGLIGGMHQLRSAELLRLTHRTPPPTVSTTIRQALPTIAPSSLEAVIANSELDDPAFEVLLQSILERLEATADPVLSAAAFRGLGLTHIHRTLKAWLPTACARNIPPTQISTAIGFGIAGLDLPDLEPLQKINAAAKDLTASRNNDPRETLLGRLPRPVLDRLVAGATTAEIETLLASLAGANAAPLVAALDGWVVDLAALDLDDVVRLLETCAMHDIGLARRLVEVAGQQTLLDRLHAETAWTTPFELRDEADGRVAAGDVIVVAPTVQTDIHGEVVAVAKRLIALAPDADFAAVSALAADGEVHGFADYQTAVKRMPRSAVLPAALPAWNRRWLDAGSALLGAPSYSDFLERGLMALKLGVPGLEQTVEAIFVGKKAEKPLARMAEAYEIARELTSPAFGNAAGGPAADSGAYVSDLQSVLHDAATELPRRFIGLPEGFGAFLMWLETLLERVDKVGQEPWSLIGEDPEPLLERMRVVMRKLHLIAGEASARGDSAALKWRQTAKSARSGNALHRISLVADQAVERELIRLRANVLQRLADLSREGEVHIRRDFKSTLTWPPASVLVILDVDHIESWEQALVASWEPLLDAAGEGRRLFLVPRIAGMVFSRLTVEGLKTGFPSPYAADSWLTEIGAILLRDDRTRRLSTLMDAVAIQDGIRTWDFGREGRPDLERATLDAATAERAHVENMVMASAASEAGDFTEALRTFIEGIDNGEFNFTAEMNATLRGYDTFVGRQLTALVRVMLLSDLITQLTAETAPEE